MSNRFATGTVLLIAAAVLGFVAWTRSSGPLEATPAVAVRGVSVDATGDNGQRKLARTTDGTLYLAFSGPVDGVEQAQVFFSLDDGETWKPDVALAQAGVWSDLPTLAAGQDGRLDAAWVDYASVGHVWHASKQGGSWSGFEKISPGEHYAGFPAMAITDDGASVLWYAAPPDESREHGSAYEIHHTVGDDGVWSSPVLLSSNSEDALNPSMAADRSGFLHGAWFQVFQGEYGAQYARFDGAAWEFPTMVSPLGGTATGVSIEVDADDVVHLVWEQVRDDSTGIAYAALSGGAWTEPAALSDSLSQDPSVAVDGDGRVTVLWSEDGSIKGRRFDGAWSSTVDLGPGTNPSTLSGERILATWTRETGAGHEIVTSYLESGEGGGLGALFWVASIALAITGLALIVVAIVRPSPDSGRSDP